MLSYILDRNDSKMCKKCRQKGLGIKFFKGDQYQKGFGLGSLFKKFIRWASPYINKAVPLIKDGLKHVGKEAVGSAANIAKDLLDGKDFQESSKSHLSNSIDNLKKLADEKMVGSGYKRKRKKQIPTHSVKKQRFSDIFSRK